MIEKHGHRLARSPVFAEVDVTDLDALTRSGRRRRLRRGVVLFSEDARSDAIALVLSGRLDVVRTSDAGEVTILRTLGSDAVVGLSTVAGAPHSADVVAGAATEVLVIPGRAVRSLFAKAPDTLLRTVVHMAKLLGEISDDIEELQLPSIEERLRRRLSRIGRGRRELSITHGELASMIGATRPNVSRAMARLEERGFLVRRRGRIELC